MLQSIVLIAGFSLGSSISVRSTTVEKKNNAHLGWSPGNACPAGVINDDPAPGTYGDMGFEWVGDKVNPDNPDTGTGDPQSACQDGGGTGIFGPVRDAPWVGVYYSMCNPKLGCTKASDAYINTIYTNVTGTRPVKGMLSGRAQGPVQAAVLQPAIQTSALATHYANPFTGGCRKNATDGTDANASSLSIVELIDPETGNHLRSHNVSGSTCAPACGCPSHTPPGTLPQCNGAFVRCPTTNLPANTTATPRCLLGSFSPGNHPFVSPTACVLVCDPSDPSGTGGPTSKCPAGATCKGLYGKAAARAGIFDSGICTYDH